MTVRSYRDLMVWQKGMALAATVHRLTRRFPKYEEYRISSQMVRAATSVPANIAEGHGRGTRKDYTRFREHGQGLACRVGDFPAPGL